MSDVTRILTQIEQGDLQAAEKLLPLVYEELRKLAAVKLANEKAGQTLQATALVHEVYVRLVGGGKEPRTEEPKDQKGSGFGVQGSGKEKDLRTEEPKDQGKAGGGGQETGEREQRWDSRGHFFGAAAEAMRRILVENARRKGRLRHGGDRERVNLEEVAGRDERDAETI